MNILFTLCGRAGSKGIAGKNEMNFLGIPLVYYALATIVLFTRKHPELRYAIALSTDSVALKRYLDESGIDYLAVGRPEELATETVSKVKAISYAYEIASATQGCSFDYVIDLDLTAPLRTVDDLEAVVEKRLHSDADTVFTVVSSRRNPYFNMVKLLDDGLCERVIPSTFNSRQEAPEIFDMNASIYGYRPSFLKSGKEIFDATCAAVPMTDTAVLDLDEPGDLALMQVVATYLFDSSKEFAEIRDTAQSFVLQQGV